MDKKVLAEWLAQPQPELVEAITRCLRTHVGTLRSQGFQFYGYALLPGEFYDINSIVAAYNCESDIKAPKNDAQYRYYFFSVDEWEHYDPGAFEPAKQQLAALNATFASLHQKSGGDYVMDEFEIAHANSILESILRGIEAAKAEGVFGATDPFLAIWIPDSAANIMATSVRRLNSSGVAEAFMVEFG